MDTSRSPSCQNASELRAERIAVQLPRARHIKRIKNSTISREAVGWNGGLGGQAIATIENTFLLIASARAGS
jgi:hypothetical protein